MNNTVNFPLFYGDMVKKKNEMEMCYSKIACYRFVLDMSP